MSKWLRHTFIIAFILSILLHILVSVFVIFLRLPMPHEADPDTIEVFDPEGMQVADQRLPGNRLSAGLFPPQLPLTKGSLYAVDPSLFAMRQPSPQKLDRKKRALPRTAVSSTMNIESQAYLSEDFYPDYSFGAHTYVNVLRHPDIEYFVRLKRAFKQTWNPFPAAQQYFASGGTQTNSIAVVLAVSVDPGGNISELFVLKTSGSGYYDEEALRTVRANAPFSSPSANLLKENLLRMSWTFIVYL